MKQADVKGFFDAQTHTISYVVSDPASKACAVVDSLLDYDAASGRTSTDSADALIAYIQAHQFTLQWIIDTHIHADHLTAAHYVKSQLGGQTVIGDHIGAVQQVFGEIFNAEASFHTDGRQFDLVFSDQSAYHLGEIECRVLHTPGHTPACTSHVIGDAVFVGDTLFMPDFGTARCDFPGGDAGQLYDSIQKLFALDDATRVFLCHDYLPPGRQSFAWETTIGEQRQHNIHVAHNTSREDFVALRSQRDAQLAMPALILPSVQINIRAGQMPPAEDNGTHYIKIPLNAI